MKPWYAREPHQLGDLRVATVADPVAVSRAWALQVLLDVPDPITPEPPKVHRLMLNREVLEWARNDPAGAAPSRGVPRREPGPRAGPGGTAPV